MKRLIIANSTVTLNVNALNFQELLEIQQGSWNTTSAVPMRRLAGEDSVRGAAIIGMFKTDKQPLRSTPPSPSLNSRFISVNNDKLRRVRDNLTVRQRDLVDVLPLLFHTNHPMLPGYISKQMPGGVCDYAPNRQALQAAKRLTMSFRYAPQSKPRYIIKGLYLMGSPGTVGYSKSSDLDIWLVHDPELESAQIAQLNAKARKIETYAASLSLEMHFFVFDAVRFRSGETLSLSDESSGSSQHYLLLDEFYRSGLLLAGLKPMWWCVPPAEEHRYEEYVCEALKTQQIVEDDYVDFGGLTDIPADEFFGAAVWQLYKSIDSPYKSVLKLLLMETYAADFPNGQLLSHRYKETIVRGQVSVTELDPYILMYRKVEEYLIAQNDSARLDLMRRSFYIKTNVQLSNVGETRIPDWQRETLHNMTLAWDWSQADIRRLDNRGDWKIPFASKERRVLIKALRRSYATLSNFVKGHGQNQKITQADLNVLGRKLYAAFERKPSKLDIITRGICSNPVEAELSLHSIGEPGDHQRWLLYSGTVTPDQTQKQKPLMQANAPIELLAWCHFNHLIDSVTIWRIYDSTQRLTVVDVRKAIDAISDCYPEGRIKTRGATALDSAPRPLEALLMVNIGVDPLDGKVQNGGVLTSNRTDAFQFGGQRINLVRSVDVLMMTSWEEVFVFHFEGENALIDAVVEYLQWATPLGSCTPPALKVCCLSKDYALPISQRVESYANNLVRGLCKRAENVDRQFVVQVEKRYCRTYAENGKPNYAFYPNYATLLKALGSPRTTFGDVEFDAGCRGVDLIKCIFDKNRSGIIQLFILERGTEADIYVVDEFGTLFTQRQECYRIEMIFDHYLQFLQNLLKTRPQSLSSPALAGGEEMIEFYRLQSRASDGFLVSPIPLTSHLASDYLSVRVFVDVDNAGKQQFTMFCEDEKFSSVDYGGRLFIAIADFIFTRRGKSERYPIHITDLELSNRFKSRRDIDNQQTIHLLNYKKRIERQLTRALRDDLSSEPRMVAAV